MLRRIRDILACCISVIMTLRSTTKFSKGVGVDSFHFDIESLWLTEKPWADIKWHAVRANFNIPCLCSVFRIIYYLLLVFTWRHKNSNYKTIDPSEILLPWCIRAAENSFSHIFSFRKGAWFCNRVPLEFHHHHHHFYLYTVYTR